LFFFLPPCFLTEHGVGHWFELFNSPFRI
jgi:hypothetical protein